MHVSKSFIVPAGAVGIGMTLFLVLGQGGASKAHTASKADLPKTGSSLTAAMDAPREVFEMPTCTGVAQSGDKPQNLENPIARRSAQRGLDFLTQATASWQEQNQCYGCHVQAVTLEALAVGRSNQYEVPQKGLNTVLEGMLTLPGGARNETGLGYSSKGSIYDAGKVFGVAALARYDQWVAGDLEKELLIEAGHVLGLQQSTGEVSVTYANAPVAIGPIQATAQAVVAWRQAYERSADTKWLIGISKAEDYLRGYVSSWRKTPSTSTQEINYAIMGLVATGMSNNDKTIVSLGRMLRSFQNEDGGWPMSNRGTSEPFATGQALYTLRLLGSTDADEGMSRGIHWLVERQQKSGGWSSTGFGKAEAMWGVLGLVSMDVLTLSISGLKDGQHVKGLQSLVVETTDNKGEGVVQVEFLVDDLLTYGTCGSSLSYDWNTGTLSTGKHIVDVMATNAEGKVSRRRFEVYAGDVYMTQLGSSYSDGGTELALRNIATKNTKAKVQIDIFSTTEGGKADKKLFSTTRENTPGAMRMHWNGLDAAGKAQDKGSYVARFRFVQEGKTLQEEQLPFVHDTHEAQIANFAQIEGSLALPSAANAVNAANAEVELIDEAGNVLQSVRSTKKGKYRFRNIAGGKNYQVRVKKKGFRSAPIPVQAEAAKQSKADFELIAE